MTVGFLVNFFNNTPFNVTLTATVTDPGDWGSVLSERPDGNISGTVLGKFSASTSFHEERHDNRSTAPFSIVAAFEGQSSISFYLDGCNATGLANDGEITVIEDNSGFSVFQVTFPGSNTYGWNTMSIYVTQSISPKSWMGDLLAQQKDLTLTELTIPGTHETGTYNGNHEEGTQCQTMTIKEQLEAGIRFMDLRVRPYGPPQNDLGIFHAKYTQNLWLGKDVLPVIVQFLEDNPNECVILCVNRAVDSDPSYDALLHDILINGVPKNKLYDHNDATAFPLTLSFLKGCVVLMRRDKEMTFGIDATAWPDNPTNAHFLAGTTDVYLQDAYKVAWGDIQGKWELIADHLDRAAVQPAGWFINFTSASEKDAPVQPWFPWGYATGKGTDQWGINSVLSRYLVTYLSGTRLGTIVMDFPEFPGNNMLSQLLISINHR